MSKNYDDILFYSHLSRILANLFVLLYLLSELDKHFFSLGTEVYCKKIKNKTKTKHSYTLKCKQPTCIFPQYQCQVKNLSTRVIKS